MKYVIIIADGAADDPLDELGGKTPLEAAHTPNMDAVAVRGVVGTARTVPAGFSAGSDVAMMSIVGYAPERYYMGRAPLEAANMGVALGDGDWAVRCNLVTIADGRMADYSAGHISSGEAASMVEALNAELGAPGVEFYAGNQYRNLLVLREVGTLEVETAPPHDITGRSVDEYVPRGRDAERFLALMDKSRSVLKDHEVNKRRRAAGKAEATSIWLWGQGPSTRLEPFSEKYGVSSAAVITAVDLVAGICALAGWERIVVEGATGYYDTDYAGKARAAVEALERFDLVMVHVEAPDEASHNRDLANKIRAIENIDEKVIGAVLGAEELLAPLRILVTADHYTYVTSGAHAEPPVPFAICGTGIEAAGAGGFGEKAAAKGLRLEDGSRLMKTLMEK